MRTALLLSLSGFVAIATIPVFPASAQQADRVVTIYGDDPCPASNGQEIVVCRRLPNAERFRIPKDLREAEAPPQKLGSSQVLAVQTTGGTARQVQSCNAIGAGVNAGCVKKEIDRAHAERRREDRQGDDIP